MIPCDSSRLFFLKCGRASVTVQWVAANRHHRDASTTVATSAGRSAKVPCVCSSFPSPTPTSDSDSGLSSIHSSSSSSALPRPPPGAGDTTSSGLIASGTMTSGQTLRRWSRTMANARGSSFTVPLGRPTRFSRATSSGAHRCT